MLVDPAPTFLTHAYSDNSPLALILISFDGVPDLLPTASIARTTSMPSSTLPKTTCLPSSQGVATVVMKNWLP